MFLLQCIELIEAYKCIADVTFNIKIISINIDRYIDHLWSIDQGSFNRF